MIHFVRFERHVKASGYCTDCDEKHLKNGKRGKMHDIAVVLF